LTAGPRRASLQRMDVKTRALAAARMPGVAWSFSRLGYRQHARRFVPGELDGSLAGRVLVVTGATSGLGLAAARALAVRGATLWLLCRDAGRGAAAAAEIARAAPAARLEVAIVDMAELGSVAQVADAIRADRIDALVHNAGALLDARRETGDGLEATFAMHVAGPHLLTRRLLPRLVAARGRVVFVSSGGMYAERLSLDDVGWTARRFDGVRAYAAAKRMQVELAALWAARAPELGVYAMHPGWADTPGVATSLPGFYRATRRFLRTPDEGADTIVWLASAPAIAAPSGSFVFDRAVAERHLLPGTEAPSGLPERLWAELERITDAAPAS